MPRTPKAAQVAIVKEAPTTKLEGLIAVHITITGISPMLQNPMTDETLDMLIDRVPGRKGGAKQGPEKTHEQIAAERLCKGPDGELGIPMTWLFAALVEAGRHVIYEKKTKLSTLTSSLVPAFLAIQDEFLPFANQAKGMWVVDKRRGVLQATGVAVGILRPKFPNWSFDVVAEVDCDQISLDKIRELFDVAGRFCGLGDFRPNKRGPFGRFLVTKWETSKLERQLPKAA